MPNVFRTTSSVTNGTNVDLSTDVGAVGLIAEGVTIGSLSSSAIRGSGAGQNVTIAGTVISADDRFIAVSLSGTDTTVVVQSTGQVSNTNQTNAAAIFLSSGSDLTNLGSVTGGTGVQIRPSDTSPSLITNHGTINGVGSGGTFIGFANYYGAGITLDAGSYTGPGEIAEVAIVNTGTISGLLRDGAVPGYAIWLQSYVLTGEFMGVASPDANVRVQIDNSGTLAGGVRTLSQADVLSNSGLITGRVELGLGNDRYDGRQGEVQAIVYGEGGDDTLIGGQSADEMEGNSGDDSLLGLDGADVLVGGSGEDTLRGGAGGDTLDGDVNNDDIFGGSGDDFILGGSGADNIRGESGDDTIDGGSASDTIDGGSGEENISGGSSADLIFGRSGDDFIRGDSGSDTIEGGVGADTISGSSGNDDINGGSGGDRIFGGANNDTLRGTLGDDSLSGSSGNDLLLGGSDNDTLQGGTGTDTLSGGNGADVFVFSAASESPNSGARDEITDFVAGLDVIDLSGFAGTLTFTGASYTGSAGEVRYNDAIGRLYISTDTDAASEFSLDIGAGAGLTADDLIL